MNDAMCGELRDLWGGIPSPASPLFAELVKFCEAHSPTVWTTLPWLAAELSYNSGFDTMLKFIKSQSGASLYLAKRRDRFNEQHGLRLTEGEYERLRRKVDCRGTLPVPSAWGVILAVRRAGLQIAIDHGGNDREIAHAFGATIRYVKQEKRKRRLSGRIADHGNRKDTVRMSSNASRPPER